MEKVRDVHFEEYGTQPEIVISAPGRIHLIGEHSWYFDDKTLSLAVNLPVYVAVSRRDDASICFHYYQIKEHKKSSLANLKFRKEDRWSNIFKSLVYAYQTMNAQLCGMNVTVYSEILPSAGFGVTTAIKAASAVLIKRLFGIPGDDGEVALKALEIASKDFLGCEFYRSDINTALFSKKGFCILTDHGKKTFEHIPIDFPETKIVLTDAKVPRISLWEESTLHTDSNKNLLARLKRTRNGNVVYEDSNSEINEVLSEVAEGGEDARRRLLCIVKENQFLTEAVQALKGGNLNVFCRNVLKSHEVLRDLFQISCPEIDWLVKRVQEFDASNSKNLTSCSRIIGKGFGRCIYSFMNEKNLEDYNQKLVDYERIFGFHALTYLVEPESGALYSNQE